MVLTMRVVGANPSAQATGRTLLSGTSNYLIGNDLNRWITNVPIYDGARYRDTYPGVDLVYYGMRGRLEYDSVVGAGADPRAVALEFEGANSVAAILPCGRAAHQLPGRLLTVADLAAGGLYEVSRQREPWHVRAEATIRSAVSRSP
jgi:hypothetical protein